MPTYLTKRGATYYFRRPVPEDLRPIIGKTELTFSLRTKDRAEAGKRCRIEAVESDKIFAAARAKIASGAAVPDKADDAEPVDVQVYASRALAALRKKRDRYAAENRLEDFAIELGEELEVQQAILDGRFGPVGSLAKAEGMRNALRAIQSGEGAMALPSVGVAPTVAAAAKTPMLPELIDKWAAEKQPKARSVDMWRRTCAMFYAVNGEKPVGAIAKADVLAFKTYLIAEGKAPATVDSRLNHLRSLFRFAVENDIIATDPAASVRAPPAKRAKEARLPYDADALKAVFGSAIYTKGERPNRGAGEAAYWLPLLALYTGARLGELGQLRPKDIVQEVYQDAEDEDRKAWVIRIVEDERDGLTLKNASSNRRVPIHQALIDLGFLRYVDAARDKGQARIFPDLKPDRYGSVTGNWTKWFGYHLREVCGVSDKRITFHSFRHSFKHYARACGLDKAVNDAITGHEGGDVADQYGGLEYPLPPLVEGMARYRVPGFTLPPPPASLR